MSDLTDRIAKLSPKRLALLALELQDRVDALERQAREPIAVVGMACRLPGANSPGEYWRLLRDGVDAVREVPPDRWNASRYFDADRDAPGKMVTRWGGFIDEIDRFDAALFGISPREAATLDPQQRLLLETAWAALEDAGHAPDRLRGSQGGVFVGIGTSDYALLVSQATALADVDAYRATGCMSHSPAAGRISYVLGLQGPSVAIDTACSSSLVAVHLACQSLRLDECTVALAGGVNAILLPELGISLSKAGMMARDGRCKTFDAAADGFVRGEGCGMVVLKRLSRAEADGDRILAIIRGTASNQDGRSNGLTAPNGPAQEGVIREALARADVRPGDVSYVETHGTGTELGDPIEVRAIGAVLGVNRPHGDRLRLGSVKTNIGHLEATAGVASLIKLVLALQHRTIPPSLHFTTPNPHIPWDEFPIEVATALTPWEPRSGRRIGGVSSFGFSGTNAHLVVEEAPASTAAAPAPALAPRDAFVLTLSGKTADAVHALAARYAARLAADDVSLGDLCFTAGAGRAQLVHRAAIVTHSRTELAAQLAALAAERAPPGVLTGDTRAASRPRVAFLFTGQGAQYAGMGRVLYASQPVFRAALDACAAGLAGQLARPLIDLLYGDGSAEIDDTAHAQPALFAIEYALASMWASWGVQPGAVLGHSVGEYAAAVIAGAVSLDDALRLVATRGRLLQSLPRTGAMAAVHAPLAVVERAVEREPGVGVAAINGPDAVVVSGTMAGVEAVEARLQAAGVDVQRLHVSHAFHSALVEPILDEWEVAAALPAWTAPRVPFVSSVTGGPATAGELADAGYWRRQVRDAVQFDAALTSLVAKGYDACVEIGPQPTLTSLGQRSAAAARAWWGGSLRRGRSDWEALSTAAAELWLRGAPIDWAAFAAGTGARRVALPTNPFQRTRFWVDAAPVDRPRDDGTAARDRQPVAADAAAFETIAPSIFGLEWDPVAERAAARAEAPAPAARVAADLQPLAHDLARQHATAAFDAVEPEIDRLCAAYVYHALRALGWRAVPDTAYASGQLAAQLGIVARHRRLFERLLDMLREEGVLERLGSTWRVRAHQALPEPVAMHAALTAGHPSWDAELKVLGRCGTALGAVLRGTQDPLPLLFPDGASSDLERIYRDSASSRVHNALLAEAVAREIERRPAGVVRVLEIGGGTGASTSSIVPRLPAGRTDYVFTDVSSFFVAQASRTFAQTSGFRARVLDIETSPSAQGFDGEAFDVVIAANVLHATRDLRRTLAHVRHMLAPGGLLLLWENVRAQRWVDLVFGLTDGWWRFEDASVRPTYPLLSAGEWRLLLDGERFDGSAALPPDDGTHASGSPHAIIAARGAAAATAGAGIAADLSTRGRWVLFADRAGLASAVRDRLVLAGDEVVLVHRAPAADEHERAVRADDAAAVRAALAEATAGAVCKGVLFLCGLDARIDAPGAGDSDAASTPVDPAIELGLVNVVNGCTAPGVAPTRIWIVTRGAQAVGAARGEAVHAGQATLWGWGRSIRLDHPELWGGLIDLDPASDDTHANTAERLVAAVRASASEDELALRGGRLYAPRVRRLRHLRHVPASLDADAAYVVSGGLGAVGLRLAGWMVDRGARHLVLIGRRGRAPLDAEAEHALLALEARGANVRVAALDVGDRAAVDALFADLARGGRTVKGVVHGAGVLEPLPFAAVDRPALDAMYTPKVAGARNLHLATLGLPLDFFVLCSTSSSVTGAQGLSHYTAANQYLDALAHHRRSLGLPALAIDWGRWDVVSSMMSAERHRWLDVTGMHAFQPAEGLAALDALLGAGVTQAMVLRAGPALVARLRADTRGGLLRELQPDGAVSTPPVAAAPPPAPPASGASASMARDQAPVGLEMYVRAGVAEALGMAPEALDIHEPINALGLDSIMALQLKNRIESDHGLKVSVVHFLNGDTVAQLTAVLLRQQAEATAASAPAAVAASDLDARAARGVDDLSDAEVEQLLARFLPNETR
jgi:acyl transferase domain-containing protein/SAM-dependent methyltransferase